jgi:hypothetical protein
MSNSDKRRANRQQVSGQVSVRALVHGEQITIDIDLLDFSARGAGFMTGYPILAGTELSLPLTQQDGRSCNLLYRTVRCTPHTGSDANGSEVTRYRIGVEFISVVDEAQVEEVLQKRSTDRVRSPIAAR